MYALAYLSAPLAITFLRSFFLLLLFLFFLPPLWGINGLWLAMPIAEAITAVLCYKTKSASPVK